ncbi:unnamed protein product [Mytilus coruscus]|uniref:Uncharacterized protein n=1 Tax=Mytilus coruscus TaxID=42192 RepID=A0A6J8DA07_MYTCO|nr:unnamed protein product [Mytilus coruscus]
MEGYLASTCRILKPMPLLSNQTHVVHIPFHFDKAAYILLIQSPGKKKYLQSVKQLSIRQQNTKFKAGTLPLYAYQKETQSVDTIDFEKLLIDEKETFEQASLIMFPTGILLLLSVEVWNLINNKKERRICDLIICKTTIETLIGSDDVRGDMFVNSPGNPFICKTINCMTISIDHVVKELYLNSQINVTSNQISISELLYEELIAKPQETNRMKTSTQL